MWKRKLFLLEFSETLFRKFPLWCNDNQIGSNYWNFNCSYSDMKKLQIPIGWKKNNCFAYCILFQSKFGCAEIIKCKIHIFLDSKPVWIVYEINLQIKLNDTLGKFFKQEKENIRNDYSIEIWKKMFTKWSIFWRVCMYFILLH